jgi:hypothetical protein
MNIEDIRFTTQIVVVEGIELPWQELKPYEPDKGSVLREGTVFVSMDTLYQLSEQGLWDSSFGNVLLLDYLEGLALEAAGLAERETRGGHHRTDLLMEFLMRYEKRAVDAGD